MKGRGNDQASSSPLSKMPIDDNSAAINMYTPMLIMQQEMLLSEEWNAGGAEGYEHPRAGGRMATRKHLFQRNVEEEEEGEEGEEREGEGEIVDGERSYFYGAHLPNTEDNMDMMAPSFLGDEDGI